MLKASSFVLNVLRHGYVIPFVSLPPRFYAENNRSALRNYEFVSDTIAELLERNFIMEVDSPSHCCNPLTVSEKGKLRLVLDLRHVNKFINTKTFRYEDLKYVAEIFEKGDFFIRFDLTSGYYHVDICEEHQEYLGFHWKIGGRVHFYKFTVLAFGSITRELRVHKNSTTTNQEVEGARS